MFDQIAQFFGKVPFQERSFVARQLAVMLDAGLPLPQAIRSLSEQSKNRIVRKALILVLRDLENGYKLSEATKKHPEVFNHIFVSVVAAGESSGKLDIALDLLADELERDNSFRSRIIGAMLYPAFIVVAMFVVGIIMVTRIVPALVSVFTEAKVSLPWTTLLVVAITNSLIHFWYLYILAVVAIIYLFIRYGATADGQRTLSNLLLNTPGVGALFLNLEMARMTRILGIMVQAGVPIIQALQSVALVMDSITFREALLVVAKNVERGAPISQTLTRFDAFPRTITEMIGVGEKTGKLEEVLKKLADFYETQADQTIKNAASLVEPAIFVVVGLGVAFLVFSIIVPIYNLSTVIN